MKEPWHPVAIATHFDIEQVDRNRAAAHGHRHRDDVIVVGAGPYGLSAAVQLRRLGHEPRVFGDPMSFWRGMPKGMLLRSNWGACHIADPDGFLTLDEFAREHALSIPEPVPLDAFVRYGGWVQRQGAPDVDSRTVTHIHRNGHGFVVALEDGEEMRADRVVVAAGIASFAWTPEEFRDLPAELASHTGEHADLSVFCGKRVLVVGGGQSALESAALLHENGAEVEVVVRKPQVVWLAGFRLRKRLGRFWPLLYAQTDVGPAGMSRLLAVPDLFRRLPREWQTPMARRAIRPAGAGWSSTAWLTYRSGLVLRLRRRGPRQTGSTSSWATAPHGVSTICCSARATASTYPGTPS